MTKVKISRKKDYQTSLPKMCHFGLKNNVKDS